MDRIILASASERRKELLSSFIGPTFDVCVSSYDEKTVENLSPQELVMYHSREKAADIARKLHEGIIISADTVVVCDEDVLGKPKDATDAQNMLKRLSGKKIQAITGITVMDTATGKRLTQYEVTNVWIREMTTPFIKQYVSTGEPEGKAGAFAVQGKGAMLVERIEGDFFNVVGLPLFRLSLMLENFGIDVLDDVFRIE